MKRLFAFAAAMLGAATLTAATPRDWTQVATPAAQGSYVLGNPAAKVKLVEYVSYSCPHCAHFTRDAAPVLKAKMLRGGSTSVEIRNSVHDKLDLAATLLARCSGPGVFPRLHDALYAGQDAWLSRGIEWDGTNSARMRLYPPAAQLRSLADGAGLTAIAIASGMTARAVDACFADPAMLERTLAVSNAVGAKIRGTPSFELNGRLIENVGWPQLEPQLRAAGAR